MDRFILFYLQSQGMDQRYMPIDRLESWVPPDLFILTAAFQTMARERLQAMSLREGGGASAYFYDKGLVFQGGQIDLNVGQGAGKGCAGQGQSRGQVRFHVGICDGLE